METLELITTEKILIFENLQEIQRIRQEIESRKHLLNNIASFGLTSDEIKKITASTTAIDDFIFDQQLKVNKELKKQHAAGAKNLQDAYELPENLKSLRYALLGWNSYANPGGRHGDKFQYLTFEDQWHVNEQALENYFVGTKYKVYLETAEEIQEYNVLLSICEYFSKHQMESTQVTANRFLKDRIQVVSKYVFKPRWQYLKGNQ